jgi:PKD repeat protein
MKMKMKIKINITFQIALIGLIIATGCDKNELGNPPASTLADFIYIVSNEGYSPCEVSFTNLSLNAAGYSWDFGNGQTSTQKDPVTSYDIPDLYTVTLTCIPVNDVYYNKAVKKLVINIKDPLAGLTQVLYFTTRSPQGGGGHMVILTDDAPLVQDFDAVDLSRPYGIAADTSNQKIYITDYSLGVIYCFSADGKSPLKILDANVTGQEIVDSPEGVFAMNNIVYWGRPGGIFKANSDGSDAAVFIPMSTTVAPEYPIDMQYDFNTGKIYFVNDRYDYSGGLFSVNFDGTSLTTILPNIDGTAIEVDTISGKIYLAAYAVNGSPITENGMYMCNPDGTGLFKFGDFGSKATWGIAIDYTRSKVLWGYKITNAEPDGKIIRANLDGSNQEDWLTGVSPHAMQIVWIKL